MMRLVARHQSNLKATRMFDPVPLFAGKASQSAKRDTRPASPVVTDSGESKTLKTLTQDRANVSETEIEAEQ